MVKMKRVAVRCGEDFDLCNLGNPEMPEMPEMCEAGEVWGKCGRGGESEMAMSDA